MRVTSRVSTGGTSRPVGKRRSSSVPLRYELREWRVERRCRSSCPFRATSRFNRGAESLEPLAHARRHRGSWGWWGEGTGTRYHRIRRHSSYGFAVLGRGFATPVERVDRPVLGRRLG